VHHAGAPPVPHPGRRPKNLDEDLEGAWFFQADIGSLPHKEFLRSIELLGTRVKPLVDAELGVVESGERAA